MKGTFVFKLFDSKFVDSIDSVDSVDSIGLVDSVDSVDLVDFFIMLFDVLCFNKIDDNVDGTF